MSRKSRSLRKHTALFAVNWLVLNDGNFDRASSNYLCHMPANSFHVAVYLKCLIVEANSPPPVVNAVYSIDWAQQLAGLPKRSEHPMVSSLISASQRPQRILGKPKSKKEPLSPEMFKALVISRIPDKSPSLSLCLVGNAGFFHFSELCALRACDIKFFPYLCVHIFRIFRDRPIT